MRYKRGVKSEMIYHAEELEYQAVMNVAQQMCAAARTAPKTKGVDRIITMVVTKEEKDALAKEMRRLADELGYGFFMRDAGNVDAAQAVVLVGVKEGVNGLGAGCNLCHQGDCEKCSAQNGVCVFNPIDLGIALGSAVAVAADHRVDNRIMFSVGRAAAALSLLGDGISMIMGIPIAVSGKSPFFDRK